MLLASVAFGLELTEWLVIGGAMYGVAELAGLSRSARTIRRENSDLRQRNTTLEREVRELSDKVTRLESQVGDLKQRDQAAVLKAIETHEAAAVVRHDTNQLRHDQAMGVWREIRDALQKGTE